MTLFGDWIVVYLFAAILSGFFACSIAERKQAPGTGLILGLLFGPLGIIAAGFLDERPQCPRCGGRLNSSKRVQYSVCQHCRFGLPEPATASPVEQERSLAGLFSGE
jgi:hypothetical protein